MAMSPDIDGLVNAVLRLKSAFFHRTWSHSYFGSVFLVPLLAYISYRLLSPSLSIPQAVSLSFICFYSHLVTDWITAYGIGLSWPMKNFKMVSLGVITIFDIVTLILWYSFFTMSRFDIISPTKLLLLFTTLLSCWLAYKRILLLIAFNYAKPSENSWLQPSSVHPFVFGHFTFDNGIVAMKAEIDTRTIRQTFAERASKLPMLFQAFFDPNLGYDRVAPRAALQASAFTGSVYRKWMRKHTKWSLVLVLAHALFYVCTYYLCGK